MVAQGGLLVRFAFVTHNLTRQNVLVKLQIRSSDDLARYRLCTLLPSNFQYQHLQNISTTTPQPLGSPPSRLEDPLATVPATKPYGHRR